MLTTRVLYNSTDEPIRVVAADLDIQPHEHVSISAQYQPVIIMENFPGLVDVTDMSEDDQASHNAEFLSKEPEYVKAEAKRQEKLAKEQTDEQG